MQTGRRQHGFTYLLVLLLIGLMGMGLAAVGTLWRTEAQREREAELLFIGMQYRQAIQRYYELDPDQPRMPPSIDALIEDTRRTEPVRHLRRAWRDPFGGAWRLIETEEGRGIAGVASTSTREPFRKRGFPAGLESFEQAASYADWQFVFEPVSPPLQTGPTEESGN